MEVDAIFESADGGDGKRIAAISRVDAEFC